MKLKYILKGTRPKTLIAGVVPCLAAYALALTLELTIDIFLFFCCIGLAICIQIATNFYNDAVDFLKGADDNRVGPERITTQDKQDAKVVFRIGHFFILLAFLLGIPLVLKGGLPIFILGLISLYFAYGYTGGPFPLAYLGLGELFVFIFFGHVATVGTFFLITGQLHYDIWIVASQTGLLSCVLIAVNNFRDKDTDKLVEKNTLATKMSTKKYLLLVDSFLFLPYLGTIYLSFKYHFILLLSLVAIIFALKISRGLKQIKDLNDCNIYLGIAGKHLALFTVLYLGGSFAYRLLS